MPRQSEHLDRKYGQHARHEIEDDPAHKSQHYRRQQREGRVSHRSLGGNRGRNRNRAGNVPALRGLIGESENAVERRRRRFRLVPTKPHNQFFRVGDDRLGSLVVDHIGVGGKEDDVPKSCRIACRNPKRQLVGRRGRSRCERIGSGNMSSGGCEGGDPFGIRRERRSHRKGKARGWLPREHRCPSRRANSRGPKASHRFLAANPPTHRLSPGEWRRVRSHSRPRVRR